MSHTLTLGYSPCPNDTFIFAALVHNQVPCGGLHFKERLEDVETLNRLALNTTLDLTKISYHAFGHVREHYTLLRSGSALGRGCGPLVVAPSPCSMGDLREKTVLIPGEMTTASLLLQLCENGLTDLRSIPFDQIMPALQRGEAAAGVIIHESRFTFADYGLHQVIDLGQWWEESTGLPIPLGGSSHAGTSTRRLLRLWSRGFVPASSLRAHTRSRLRHIFVPMHRSFPKRSRRNTSASMSTISHSTWAPKGNTPCATFCSRQKSAASSLHVTKLCLHFKPRFHILAP